MPRMFGGSFENIGIIFIVGQIFIVLVFVFVILMIFVPKVRAKFMGNHIKATKYMIDDNEEDLRHITNKAADIGSEGIERTVRAVKRGLSDDSKYCKYCGASIDGDAIFCSKCGKEQ